VGGPGAVRSSMAPDDQAVLAAYFLPDATNPPSCDPYLSWSTDSTFPAGSLNQAMYGPSSRKMPLSSCSMWS
jgi:hypothetical protein